MINLKYPILFVHGMGFRDGKNICYWGRIPKVLKKEGCSVFFGEQDSNGSVEDNGKFLAERIKKLALENDIEKFNVVAHSKGGLDIRYAVSTLGMDKYVASISTISTPHNGSVTVDKLMKLPSILIRIVAGCSDMWLRLCGDKNPNAYSVYNSLTTEYACKFNKDNPNVKGVYYQSFAFTFNGFFSDILLWFPHFIVKCVEGENDGLLTPDSVKWGEFQGIYKSNSKRGISHCDEVDLRRCKLTAKKGNGISDITEFYLELAQNLSEKGF